MSLAENNAATPESLISAAHEAVGVLDQLLGEARMAVEKIVRVDGRIDGTRLEREQHAAHGLAWLATYVEALRQMASYGERQHSAGRFGEIEQLIFQIAFGEYLSQIAGGIPMNQGEFIRLSDLGLTHGRAAALTGQPSIQALIDGNSPAIRARLMELLVPLEGGSAYGDGGLDETLEAFREEMRRFAGDNVVPHAHEWHLANEYIPLEVIGQMAELGVFGLTIPEEYGGLGLGKESMCVVSEELSRAYIGVGSLGTRSEIAAELLLAGGTPAQKAHWLPKIAPGEVLPTADFTAPIT